MTSSNEINTIKQQVEKVNSIKAQISTHIRIFTNLLGKMSGYSNSKAHFTECINELKNLQRSAEDFIRNYNDMKISNVKYQDKYFHAKANCQAAQRGNIGVAVSQAISFGREFTDQFNNTLRKGMTLKASIEDSLEDDKANRYGRTQGKNNPNANCADLLNKYRPNGLNPKY